MTYLEKLKQEHPDKVTDDRPSGCILSYGYSNNHDICQLYDSCQKCWEQEIPEDKKDTYRMTCREKLAIEHPQFVGQQHMGGCAGCPHAYGYLPRPSYCNGARNSECYECWDRVISGYTVDEKAEEELHNDIPKQWPKENPFVSDSIKAMCERLKASAQKCVEEIEKAKDIFKENGGLTVVIEPKTEHAMHLFEEPVIKDSGDRTKFETGAVRDMREGKGRCDLMPLKVVAEIFGHDPILEDIACFLDEEDEQGTGWLYGALDNFSLKAYGKKRTTMLLEVAKHFEEGAKKYGENNWQKGIPVKCYIDSAVRHYLKWLRGDKDEPHDRAFVWNIMCCIWEVDHHVDDTDKSVRFEDCPIGLFSFKGMLYTKVNKGAIRVSTGEVEALHPDILVWPITIEEKDE